MFRRIYRSLPQMISIVLAALWLAGCTTATPGTAIPQPTLVPSSTPFPTSTPTLTPTVALPVLAGTPAPLPIEPITPQNVAQIQELAIWGKGGQIKDVAYSPDGDTLAVGTTTGIWLYKGPALALHRFIRTEDWVANLTFSPDNSVLFAAIGYNTAAAWDVATGALMHWLDVGKSVRTFYIDDVPLVAEADGPQIELWNMAGETLVKTLPGLSQDAALPGYGEDVMVTAFSPDGTLLAAGLRYGTIWVWDVPTATLLYALDKDEGSALGSLTFSSDGMLLASGGTQGLIPVRIWDVKTGKLLHSLQDQNIPWVEDLTFSPDGITLASGSFGLSVAISGLWSVDGAPDDGYRHPSHPRCDDADGCVLCGLRVDHPKRMVLDSDSTRAQWLQTG